MIVHVGSTNKTKINAVSTAFAAHERFKNADVVGVAVDIPEFGHPKDIDETVSGAMERAKQAFHNCDYGIGIEGGLMAVPHTKTGFMEVAACAIFDGTTYHVGLSPALEWPKVALEGILEKGFDGSQAFREAGLTDHPKLGLEGGIIAVLTNGSVDRTLQNSMAVQMALAHLHHPRLYR